MAPDILVAILCFGGIPATAGWLLVRALDRVHRRWPSPVIAILALVVCCALWVVSLGVGWFSTWMAVCWLHPGQGC
jgi:hypothetical protein